MDLYKKIPFQFEDKNYEIRILYQDNMINISTFLDNHPANGFRYQIQIPKHVKIEKLLNEKHLIGSIDQAKKDIVENRWEYFTKIF